MNSANTNLHFISNFSLHGIMIFISTSVICAQSISGSDSLKGSSEASLEIKMKKTEYQKSTSNFYLSDSIFSFRSPKGYFPSLVHNIGSQATAPLRFTAKKWIYTGVLAGITTALIFADEDIDEWARIQKQKHQWINKSSPVITDFGSNYGLYVVIANGLISAVLSNEKGVQTSLLATQAFITSGIWAQILKQLTGRERPEASYIYSHTEGGQWHSIFSRYSMASPFEKPRMLYDAFPSGHTATAFSIATVFALQYSNIKAIPIICYSAASAVGISRLTEHEHWASDVFAGAVIGYLSGRQVVNNFKRTHPESPELYNTKPKKYREISFIQNGNEIGMSIVW
jgi:membrane-associated phospholipid phosphatase